MSKGSTRKWEDLEVSEGVRNFIKAKGFKKMTPVQSVTIPTLISGKDVAVEACTGSGKTLAFLIPVVEMLMKVQNNPDRMTRRQIDALPADEKAYRLEGPSAACRIGSVILSPTRELAQQTYADLNLLLKSVLAVHPDVDLKALCFTGGRVASVDEEIVRKQKCPATLSIWVGTPGRMMHLLETLKLKQDYETKYLEILILDEADRLLNEEFSKHVSVILAKLPKQRRTGLFSATLTSESKRLTLAGMRYPVHIKVDGAVAPPPSAPAAGDEDQGDESETHSEDEESVGRRHALPKDLQHLYLEAGSQDHLAILVKLVNEVLLPSGGCAIAFGLSCAGIDFLYRAISAIQGDETKDPNVPSRKVFIERMHGHLTQKQRNATLLKFKDPNPVGHPYTAPDGRCPRLLLCTDVAARGLDVKDLDLVIQLDAAKSPAEFVHRSGRAGRAGRAGTCLTLLRPSEDVFVNFMDKRGLRLRNAVTVAKDPLAAERTPNAADALYVSRVLADSKALAAAEQTIIEKVRAAVLKDRDLFLAGSKAFVTFIRAYQAHELTFIFPFHAVDLDGLARLYCLLRIPKIKELQAGKHARLNVERWSTVKPDEIAFTDPVKEAARQEQLIEEKVKVAELIAGKRLSKEEALASAETAAAQLAEKERREKLKKQQENDHMRTRTEKRDAKRRRVDDDWEDLAREERLAKKLKKGKLTVAEYEKQLKKRTDDSDDSAESDSDLDEFDRIGREMDKKNQKAKKGGAKDDSDEDMSDSDDSDSDDFSDSEEEISREEKHKMRSKNAKAVPKWAMRGTGTKGR